MKKTFLIFTFIAAFLALTINVPAQRVKDTPVTSTIENADQNFVPFRIQSDFQGSYKNGTDSVISRIQPIGDWELNMLSSATRRAFIDFGDPVAGNDPNKPPPFLSAYVPVRFLAQCGSDLRILANGSSQTCKMVIAVDYGADRYSIRFGYVAGTSQTLWTCGAEAGGKCARWRMTGNTDGTGRIAAELLKVTTVRGKTVTESFGKYYFSFGVNVTNP